jgi:hypothetical protein
VLEFRVASRTVRVKRMYGRYGVEKREAGPADGEFFYLVLWSKYVVAQKPP